MSNLENLAAIIASATNGKVIGRTRLQKLICLLDLANEGINEYKFSYFRYGPYCDELADDMIAACAFEYVKETIDKTESGRNYSIYEASQDVAHQNITETKKQIIDLCTDEKTKAINLELAVTAAWLAKNGETNPWKKVEEVKWRKKGRVPQAKKLYKEFQKINKELPEINS